MTPNTKIATTAILAAAVVTVIALGLARETKQDHHPENGNVAESRVKGPLPEGNFSAPPAREEEKSLQSLLENPELEAKSPDVKGGEQEPHYVAPTQLESNLDIIAESFATETPDIEMLLEVTGVLANAMNVVPGSLEFGEESSNVSGELQLGENLSGSFRVTDGSYSIQLMRTDPTAGARHQISFTFGEKEGSARNAKIQLQSYASKIEGAPSLGGNTSIGWRGSIDESSGSYLQRTKMTILDLGTKNYLYETNDDSDFKPLAVPQVSKTDSFDLWKSRLQGIQ